MEQQQQIEREAARVAAAFGVSKSPCVSRTVRGFMLGIVAVSWPSLEGNFECDFDLDTGQPKRFCFDTGVVWSTLKRNTITRPWARSWDKEDFRDFYARGLYCLGFEDQAILAQLPPLSAHEQLELRLQMPREFWPQKWIDEL